MGTKSDHATMMLTHGNNECPFEVLGYLYGNIAPGSLLRTAAFEYSSRHGRSPICSFTSVGELSEGSHELSSSAEYWR